MLDIKFDEEGKILLSGRFDASQVEKAKEFFKSVSETRIVDMANLEYISSAGLGAGKHYRSDQARLVEGEWRLR